MSAHDRTPSGTEPCQQLTTKLSPSSLKHPHHTSYRAVPCSDKSPKCLLGHLRSRSKQLLPLPAQEPIRELAGTRAFDQTTGRHQWPSTYAM